MRDISSYYSPSYQSPFYQSHFYRYPYYWVNNIAYKNGNDVSAWQGDINFDVMKNLSDFVYIRKSIGYYSDLRFWDNFDGAKLAGMPMGIYHYFYAGYNVERQFAKMIEGIQPSDLTFPPVLDVEHKHRVSKSQAVGEVLKFLHLLKSWWTGPRMPAIYTAKFVWQDYYSFSPGWIHDWDLFVANYTTDVQPRYVPIGWEKTSAGVDIPIDKQFVCWQWEADGNRKGPEHGVSSHDIDMDRMPEWYFNTFVLPVVPDEEIDIEVIVPQNVNVKVTIRET